MKKILVVRFSSIGDIVLTSPVIRCLKNQIADAEIHYLTKETHLPILKNNPYIDKIYTIKKNIQKVLPELRKEHYDYIIDLHNSIRSNALILNLCRPFNTVKKQNIKKELYVSTKINLLPKTHIVDRYFKTVEFLKVFNDGKGLDYFIPEADMVDLKELPETHRNGYVALVIGGKHYTKRMPENKLISLCKKIDKPIIILGGSENAETAMAISEAVGEKVFNSCGLFSLNQSASIVKRAKQVISNDTGLMHISTAFNVPVISVWGNTVPAFGMYPYYPKGSESKSKIIEVKGLSCRPCSKLGFEKCPKEHFNCMNQINEEEIISSIHWD